MTDGATGGAGPSEEGGSGLVVRNGRVGLRPWQRRLLLVVGLILAMVAGLVLPPLVNISRYQRRITELVSRSFGRQVRLSGVELRLLPLPGFVLHDLSVAEDPSYGVEPVLSARTVIANVRLLALWRGRIEVDRITVDEASVNVVRTGDGHWNLESLMMGPAEPALTGKAPATTDRFGTARERQRRFPYLRATNSRINLKNGLVKSPFSLVNADLSLWQDQPGEWGLRLTGQPFRTDTEVSFQADNGTGDVRIEGTLHAAQSLREMPLKLEMEWRDAQLGQLSRLILGSDAGWRGDIVADVEVEGTSEAAKTKARLRATGVRRAEFAPETPLDFDANCAFVYQHSLNAFHQVGCDTAVGNGHLYLKGDRPGGGAPANGTLEVKDLPVQAGLDLLRTLRSDFAPGMNARGRVNGSLSYRLSTGDAAKLAPMRYRGGHRGGSRKPAVAAPPSRSLDGALTVEEAELRGGGLKEPLLFPKMTWTARAPTDGQDAGAKAAIGAKFAVPIAASLVQTAGAGKPAAAAINTQFVLSASGYSVKLSGAATPARMRELAYAFGMAPLDAADGFAGGTADFDLSAAGPWIAPERTAETRALDSPATGADSADAFLGTIQLHHAEWQAPYLHHALELPQATVTLSAENIGLTSDFTYGALAGSIAVTSLSRRCRSAECPPAQVTLRLGAVEADAVRAALLGAPERKTLLSPLMDRMRSADKATWPAVALSVTAESLALGPVTLQNPNAQMHLADGKLMVDGLDADLLGGSVEVKGSLAAVGDKVEGVLDGAFKQIAPTQAGQLVGAIWTGKAISGAGMVEFSGAARKDLAASAKGQLQFEWKEGTFAQAAPSLARFDRWSGTASIAGGKLELGENRLKFRGGEGVVRGVIPFSGTAKLTVGAPAP